jgi:hypothetical protein
MHHKHCYSNEAFHSVAANFNAVFFQLGEMRNSLAYAGKSAKQVKGALSFFTKPATPHINFQHRAILS